MSTRPADRTHRESVFYKGGRVMVVNVRLGRAMRLSNITMIGVETEIGMEASFLTVIASGRLIIPYP